MNRLNQQGRKGQAERREDGEEVAEAELEETLQALMRVVPDAHTRPGLSRRWAFHACHWAVGCGVGWYSVQSHLTYRALCPSLVPTQWWRCVAAMRREVAEWAVHPSHSVELHHGLLTLRLLVGRVDEAGDAAVRGRSCCRPSCGSACPSSTARSLSRCAPTVGCW